MTFPLCPVSTVHCWAFIPDIDNKNNIFKRKLKNKTLMVKFHTGLKYYKMIRPRFERV